MDRNVCNIILLQVVFYKVIWELLIECYYLLGWRFGVRRREIHTLCQELRMHMEE